VDDGHLSHSLSTTSRTWEVRNTSRLPHLVKQDVFMSSRRRVHTFERLIQKKQLRAVDERAAIASRFRMPLE